MSQVRVRVELWVRVYRGGWKGRMETKDGREGSREALREAVRVDQITVRHG